MDWKLILDVRPPVARVLVVYDPDVDDFTLAIWDGDIFIGYDSGETYEKFNLYWAILNPPDIDN